jgi:hypothetical protein
VSPRLSCVPRLRGVRRRVLSVAEELYQSTTGYAPRGGAYLLNGLVPSGPLAEVATSEIRGTSIFDTHGYLNNTFPGDLTGDGSGDVVLFGTIGNSPNVSAAVLPGPLTPGVVSTQEAHTTLGWRSTSSAVRYPRSPSWWRMRRRDWRPLGPSTPARC